MKTIAIAALSALSLMTLTNAASAYDWRENRIDARERNQEARIQRGVQSGQITRHERRHLEAEQARIRAMERNALRDGHIDRREAAGIRRAQNEASRHIYQESHDSQTRWSRRWW